MPRSLQAELQQRTPFHSREEEALLSVVRTADHLTRRVAELLKRYDLTPTQYNVLRILRGAAGDGLLTGEVGARLVTHDPDVTRLLDRMARRGWLERTRETGDRRCVRAVLTPAGRTLVDALDAPMAAALRGVFAHVPSATLDALIELLGTVRAPGAAAPAHNLLSQV